MDKIQDVISAEEFSRLKNEFGALVEIVGVESREDGTFHATMTFTFCYNPANRGMGGYSPYHSKADLICYALATIKEKMLQVLGGEK